jgi:hypothetical protein
MTFERIGFMNLCSPFELSKQYAYGNDVWPLGDARVYYSGQGTLPPGRETFVESSARWFCNHRFLHGLSVTYDAKTFERLESSEITSPPWDVNTLQGFCAAVGSVNFEQFLRSGGSASKYALDGNVITHDTGCPRFVFKEFGSSEILFNFPEILNGWVAHKKLWEAIRGTIVSPQGMERIRRLTNV